MSDGSEDFLRRWSRRKVEARQGLHKKEDTPARASEDAAPPTEGESSEAAVTSEEPVLAEADFADVDFDKLDFSSDYTRFMQKGVPEAIKRRALRKLWTSDPVLACVDGLNDYDLDYTDAATVVKDLKTSWKIGRGFLTDEDLGIEKPADEDGVAEAEEPAEPELSESSDTDAEPQTTRAEAEQTETADSGRGRAAGSDES